MAAQFDKFLGRVRDWASKASDISDSGEAGRNILRMATLAEIQASVSLEKVFVASAGVEVNYADMSVRLPAGGNRSLQFKVAAAEHASYISEAKSSTYAYAMFDSSITLANAWQYVDPGRSFASAGAIQECSISLLSSARLYKLTLVIGVGYNNNIIVIRRVK